MEGRDRPRSGSRWAGRRGLSVRDAAGCRLRQGGGGSMLLAGIGNRQWQGAGASARFMLAPDPNPASEAPRQDATAGDADQGRWGEPRGDWKAASEFRLLDEDACRAALAGGNGWLVDGTGGSAAGLLGSASAQRIGGFAWTTGCWMRAAWRPSSRGPTGRRINVPLPPGDWKRLAPTGSGRALEVGRPDPMGTFGLALAARDATVSIAGERFSEP